MPQPRKAQISLADTPYYHCISRCVRRAYLCGQDPVTGKSFSHRRKWVEDKLLFLPKAFAIDVCSYAVMSNHCHVVLKVQLAKATSWSTKEILLRWHKVFNGTRLTAAFLAGSSMSESELETIMATAEVYRQRLTSISWFMRVLNEHIARAANNEDECTGRFWEGRFKCQALLDEAAVIACMAYVDLNPIRANAASSLKGSDHTSIQLRIKHAVRNTQPKALLKFSYSTQTDEEALPFTFNDYLALMDLTSRCIIEGKGYVKGETLNILNEINISPNNWLTLCRGFRKVFVGPAGRPECISQFAGTHNRTSRTGITNAIKLFG